MQYTDPDTWPLWAQLLFLGVPCVVVVWAIYVLLAIGGTL